MKIRFKIIAAIVICFALCLITTIPAIGHPKPTEKTLFTNNYRIDETTCVVCGKPINGYAGESSSIAWSLHLDVCEECFLQILFGNDITTPLLRVAQLGEDGKVLPAQLPVSQGGGDMLKSAYDPNSDNRIAEAQLLLSYPTHSSSLDHSHSNKIILDAIQESFTTSLKTSYDWLVTNITSAWKTTVDNHVSSQHAPSNAQKNSDITKAEIEAKLTGEISSHSHAGGGGESESVVVLSANRVNSTTTLANCTDLSFVADANSTYIIDGFIVWDTSATTVGVKISATASGSPTITSGHFITDAASGTPDSSTYNANDVVTTTSASAYTNDNFGKLDALLVTSGSTSTWQLRFAAETTGSIVIQQGSTIRYRKVSP